MYTKRLKLMLVLVLFIGAYFLSNILLTLNEHQSINHWSDRMVNAVSFQSSASILNTILVHLIGCFVVFPSGFGFQALEPLMFLPHLSYLVLGTTIVVTNSMRTFRTAMLLFVGLLTVNVYGCSFTPHNYTF